MPVESTQGTFYEQRYRTDSPRADVLGEVHQHVNKRRNRGAAIQDFINDATSKHEHHDERWDRLSASRIALSQRFLAFHCRNVSRSTLPSVVKPAADWIDVPDSCPSRIRRNRLVHRAIGLASDRSISVGPSSRILRSVGHDNLGDCLDVSSSSQVAALLLGNRPLRDP